MSGFIGPIQSAAAGVAGGSESVARSRDRRDRQQVDKSRRFLDAFEHRVAGVEAPNAVDEVDEEEDDGTRDEHNEQQTQHQHDLHADQGPGSHIDITG